MVYFNNVHKSLKVLFSNWKILIPSLAALFMSLFVSLVFIYMNDLFGVILKDPSSLFVSGGLSMIAKKVSAVLITKSQIIKLLLSLVGFIMANFMAGSSFIAMKYVMIESAINGKKIGVKKSFYEGTRKYYWKVIEMRVMVFVLIVILSLILSLPFFIFSKYFGGYSMLVALGVISVLLLIRLILLFRYPILFKEKLHAIPALSRAIELFNKKRGYVFNSWFISVFVIFLFSVFFEFIRVFMSDPYYGVKVGAVFLLVFYLIKELIMAVVGMFVDVFVYVSYLKVRK